MSPARTKTLSDERAKRIAKAIKPLQVKPGRTVKLDRDFAPDYKADFMKKKDGVDLLAAGVEVLAE